MVAMKHSVRSIFHFLSITPLISDASRRTNNVPVVPRGKSYCWIGRITIEQNLVYQIESSDIPPSSWVPSLLRKKFSSNVLAIFLSILVIS